MIDGNEVYISNNENNQRGIDWDEYKKRIRKILVNSAKALKSNLEDYGIVGCGFWEMTEQKLFEVIEDMWFGTRE